jgi:hypothetical protein
MSAKSNTIEDLPAMSAGSRALRLRAPIAPVRLVRAQHASPSAWIDSWVMVHSAQHSAAESLETLTYAILWLCGLISVGICFS